MLKDGGRQGPARTARYRRQGPRREPPTRDYKIGGKLEVIAPHCDPVVNEYDQMYGTRKDRVEVVWKITARGKSQ
jgi:D-serine deaminase-like pyridoxal phosphate-dependent protein